MIGLLLGGVALFLLLGGMRAFERASVKTIKSLLAWVAALGGLCLTLLLILSGRGPLAFFALSLAFPLLREQFLAYRAGNAAGPSPGAGAERRGAMSRAEAYEVLGLRAGADEAEIQQAYIRLMRSAHPDGGGSDWLATRVNQARDVLLGRGRRS